MPVRPNTRKINLALQGGGAHGAFAWGVLDRLLEDERIEIEGICATSAGTMNACALAYGMHLGSIDGTGRQQARDKLADFWWKIHEVSRTYSLAHWFPHLGAVNNGNASFFLFETVTRLLSPYQLNPFDFNPLRDVLTQTIDFEDLSMCECIRLFISATNVRTGQVQVFEAPELSIDVAMASACLPFLFKAVEIDGEAYWDGGYTGNPALYPIFYKTESRDILIVHINPIHRPQIPVNAQDIMNRVNEISFNSSLLKELRAIAFVKKLIEHDMLKPNYLHRYKDVLIHSVRADEAMCEFSVATKFDTSWGFLTELRDRGRSTMESWLAENFHNLGERDSVDLHGEFLNPVNQFSDRGKLGEVPL